MTECYRREGTVTSPSRRAGRTLDRILSLEGNGESTLSVEQDSTPERILFKREQCIHSSLRSKQDTRFEYYLSNDTMPLPSPIR